MQIQDENCFCTGNCWKNTRETGGKSGKRTVVRKQDQITEETLFCAGWMVVIISLGVEYCGEGILYLYRSR